MRDDVVALAFIAFTVLSLCGFGYFVADRMDKSLVMYEVCIANGMQWVEGSCVE